MSYRGPAQTTARTTLPVVIAVVVAAIVGALTYRVWAGSPAASDPEPQATPATYYIEMDPGIANAEDSGLADEVASSDYLILSNVWNAWDEPNDSRDFGSDAPNQVVDDQFCPLNPETDFYILYERC